MTRAAAAVLPRRPRWPLGVGLLAVLTAGAVAAAGEPPADVDWLPMMMGLFGGLSLFLYGMEQMAHGLKAAAGEGLKVVLGRLTGNRFLGALTGAVVTAILNSSSVTTVLVVGFITAGVMTLPQSIGVIMGANIGSTFTAQIIAFNVTQYALLMVAPGFLMLFAGKRDGVRHAGEMLMGLGLVFFGMGLMSDGMAPLRSYQPFIDLMARMEQPLLGIVVGAAFTGLVQSSAATTGIAIAMASEGLISLPAGIALAFGANIGTCVTALLAAIGKPTPAVRAAVAHIVFNVAGVALWFAFIPELASFVEHISPTRPDLEGAARAAAEVPRQIANAHTVFNVANTALFIWTTTWFARLVAFLVPERPPDERRLAEPKFLDEELVDAPALALERVRLEIGHVGGYVAEMMSAVPIAFRSRERAALDAIAKMDDQVDLLETRILEYLGRIRRQALSEAESRTFQGLMTATEHLESVGDVVETDLATLGREWIDSGFEASETMRALLVGLYETVANALDTAVRAVTEDDQRAAQDVMALKAEVDRLAEEALAHQAAKLTGPERLQIFRLEMSFVDKVKRIYTLSRRIARTVLPEELQGPAE